MNHTLKNCYPLRFWGPHMCYCCLGAKKGIKLSLGPKTPLVTCVFYFVLICTCFWLNVNRYTCFWHFPKKENPDGSKKNTSGIQKNRCRAPPFWSLSCTLPWRWCDRQYSKVSAKETKKTQKEPKKLNKQARHVPTYVWYPAAHNGWNEWDGTYSCWKIEWAKKKKERPKEQLTTMHTMYRKMVKKKNSSQKRLKARHSKAFAGGPGSSLKRARFVFGQSRGSWGVFLAWFQGVPVFDTRRTGYTLIWLLPFSFFLKHETTAADVVVEKRFLFFCFPSRSPPPSEAPPVLVVVVLDVVSNASMYRNRHIELSIHSMYRTFDTFDISNFRYIQYIELSVHSIYRIDRVLPSVLWHPRIGLKKTFTRYRTRYQVRNIRINRVRSIGVLGCPYRIQLDSRSISIINHRGPVYIFRNVLVL